MERFSTDDIPERDRESMMNDVVARHIAGRRFSPMDNADLKARITAFKLPGRLMIAASRYSPVVGSRTTEMLDDGRDDYLLTIHSRDHEVSVDGREPIAVPAGDMMLITEAVRSRCRLPSTDVRVVSLSRVRLLELAPRIDLDAFHHLPANTPGLGLISGYSDLLRDHPPRGQRAAEIASAHVYDLVGLVLDGCVRGGAARNLAGIRAARLDLVKHDILEHLTDAALSISKVARRQGVTPRYIQQLFAAEGEGFSQFLRNGRLELAFRRLNDPAGGARIADIAFDAGFSDLSTFNRAFRRRFDLAPSDVRAQAMRRH